MNFKDAKATFLLEHCAEQCDGYQKDDACENCEINVAIKAIDKQIAKKPKIIDHWRMCPRCYEEYGFSYDILVGTKGLKTGECRCLNCGQAIDWEA